MRDNRQAALSKLRKAAERGNRMDRPDMLRVDEIAVCPAVFQPRAMGDRDGIDARHTEALVAALASKPTDAMVLDPITVFAIGSRFYVLDGHHRRAAYEAAGISSPVPVEHFSGSIEEALSEPLRINAKVHLNMSREERNGAAWRLVAASLRDPTCKLTGPKIVSISGLSLRTVDRMRALCRRLMAMEDGEDWSTPPLPAAVWEDYREAERFDHNDASGADPETWIEATVDRWIDGLGKTFGNEGHKHPTIFGRALMGYLGEHDFSRMAEDQGFAAIDPEAYEMFLEWKDNRANLTGQ